MVSFLIRHTDERSCTVTTCSKTTVRSRPSFFAVGHPYHLVFGFGLVANS